ncbi:hypothetical protein CROQUDRAFT_103854 [Cronartium quercuum f. sp. fusiforme G11]|uniref:Uncharacterized protein n=1 Tax=Cronartium quercuum f. sp. fusiforme G11 TaxID=708437 RepID=A0A9P6NXF1_9BASI|nr:hypothetical protein CROQUDRAFT_103854 [Cronartium quercuum f. sp. fusiforme G11]
MSNLPQTLSFSAPNGSIPLNTDLAAVGAPTGLAITFYDNRPQVGTAHLSAVIHYIHMTVKYPNGTTINSEGLGSASLAPTSEADCTWSPSTEIHTSIWRFDQLGKYTSTIDTEFTVVEPSAGAPLTNLGSVTESWEPQPVGMALFSNIPDPATQAKSSSTGKACCPATNYGMFISLACGLSLAYFHF